jgi:hypothetical protein
MKKSKNSLKVLFGYQKFQFLFLFAILSLVFSCNQSQSSINKASKMIENAEQQKDQLEKSDFNKLEIYMEDLQKNLQDNRKNYTDEQVREIGKLQGRYAALLLKKGINDFKESVKDLDNQMDGFMEGVTDSSILNNN